MEFYIASLIMISAGMVGSKALFPEIISNVIKKIEVVKIVLGIILLLSAIYICYRFNLQCI